MSLYTEHVQQYGKVVRLDCSWALWKEQNEAFPTVPPSGQTDKWKALKPRVKAENVPKWAQCSQESIWGENDKEGGAGKGSGSKGCRGAEHGQACTKERTGAVAVRAALESAVQVGRGDEGNRQAEMANPTKCRDSLLRRLRAYFWGSDTIIAISIGPSGIIDKKTIALRPASDTGPIRNCFATNSANSEQRVL
jgi:hypothetical protein